MHMVSRLSLMRPLPDLLLPLLFSSLWWNQAHAQANSTCKSTQLDWYNNVVGETPCEHLSRSSLLMSILMLHQARRTRACDRYATTIVCCAPFFSVRHSSVPLPTDEVQPFRSLTPGDNCDDQVCEYTPFSTNGPLEHSLSSVLLLQLDLLGVEHVVHEVRSITSSFPALRSRPYVFQLPRRCCG